MKIIYDSWDPECKSVFGAVKTEEFCSFTLRVPAEYAAECSPVMEIYRPGFKKQFITMCQSKADKDTVYFTATFTTIYTGLYLYSFFLQIDGKTKFITRSDYHIGTFDEGEPFQLTVYSPDFETPDFIKGGIMYQIFPDRFCRSGAEHKNIPDDRMIRNDWGGTPIHTPHPETGLWNYDYFGGDLKGIESKLGYLKDLGITCIYLNPVFESHENHRYSVADYMKIDPMLGTNDDFRELCSKAEEFGISIIIDGVFSHTGANSIYFNKYNYYDSIGAYNSRESEYYEWYTFTSYPDTYEAWWGIDTLPNTNENNYSFTQFICDDNGVLNYWLSMGAAGVRLDVADELPDTFLYNVRKSVKNTDKEKLIIGEVWNDASNTESYGIRRRYLLGGQLDSVMNYPFREYILSYIKDGDKDFRKKITAIMENYPKPSIDVLMNIISTHDVERAISVLAGESSEEKDKDWMSVQKLTDKEYNKGKKMLKLAMVLMFFLPGVPCIYYGDEAGMQGYKDPFNRGCYPWGSEDKELIEFVKQLSKLRKNYDIFKEGHFRFIMSDEDVTGFARISENNKKAVLIFVNRSGETQYIERIKNAGYSKSEVLIGQTDHSGEKIILDPYSYAFIEVEK